MTEIVGPHGADIAALRDDIPLTSPDPASVDEWVTSARQDNPTVRAAGLQARAQEHDIAVQLLWIVGLLAVLVPALRAASISPAVATRTV